MEGGEVDVFGGYELVVCGGAEVEDVVYQKGVGEWVLG